MDSAALLEIVDEALAPWNAGGDLRLEGYSSQYVDVSVPDPGHDPPRRHYRLVAIEITDLHILRDAYTQAK